MSQAPAYGASPGPPPRASGLATTSLVLGIVSLLCCPSFVLGVAAAVTGFLARREILASPHTLGGERSAATGMALGVLSLVVGATAWIVYAAGVSDVRLNY